jgi:hypothetical protein
MPTPEELKEEYEELLPKYLAEAESVFGKKTKYELVHIGYDGCGTPKMVMVSNEPIYGITFKVWLRNSALTDRKDGVFQLSHEVVHLISPVEQVDGKDANYLEEGMAVHLAKKITEREYKDFDYCNIALAKQPKYFRAYMQYMSLVDIDPDTVKKIRKHQKVIGKIQPEDFKKAGIKAPAELIGALLEKF